MSQLVQYRYKDPRKASDFEIQATKETLTYGSMYSRYAAVVDGGGKRFVGVGALLLKAYQFRAFCLYH